MRLSFLVLWVALATGPASASAQLPAPTPGSLQGSVVDAVTERPVYGATVTLSPSPEGVVAGAEGRLLSSRTTTTELDGSYAFDRLAGGRYRLTVDRAGYRSQTLDVELSASGGARVSVALEVSPIALEPVTVTAVAEPLFRVPAAGAARAAAGDRRVLSEQLRQRSYLEPDVRALTAADVAEAVTLGESDLFRALQRLPGVSTRDEFSAELWTRGAPWHATRVLFDGLPLYNPLHAFGLIGGVHPDVVGSAYFHPGVRPASLAGAGSAATLDVRSRPAGIEGGGSVELSLVSGRASAHRPIGEGSSGLTVALRRTWIDWLTNAVSEPGSDSRLPFRFWDAAARLDVDLGEGGTLELSGLVEGDGLDNDLPDVVHGIEARRSNRLGRIGWSRPLGEGAYMLRASLGTTRFSETVDTAPSLTSPGLNAPSELPHTMALRHVRLSGEIHPDRGANPPPWRAGLLLSADDTEYSGPIPFPVPTLDPGRQLDFGHRATRLTGWVDVRRPLSDRLTGEVGMRATLGPDATGAAPLLLAPRASLRVATSARSTVTVSFGRSHQTEHMVGPLGPWVGELAHWGSLWMSAGDTIPVETADVLTVGAESWLGSGWLAGATAYRRSTSGAVMADPRAGYALDRRVFLIGTSRADGVELSLRRVAGQVTGSVAVSSTRARQKAAGLRVPSPSERRAALDATLALALTPGFTVGAAYTWMDGAPYRRVFPDLERCPPTERECTPGEYLIEQAGARRTRDYRSLDLMLEWSGGLIGERTSLFVQVRNVLARENPGTYRRTALDCGHGCGPGRPIELDDEFAPGIPFLPLIGFRATW